MSDAPIVERFLRYVSFDTQSDAHSSTTPSTAKQLVLARELVAELQAAGVVNARLLPSGIVMGSIPATPGFQNHPAIGFISHMDTAPDAAGGPVHPRIVRNYDGKDIELNKQNGLKLSPNQFPNLLHYVGEDLIVTDGTTLLGADDKSGIAAIMGMALYCQANPSFAHAKISIAFTPDEEIARSIKNFDVKEFGADYAFTVDGPIRGRLSVRTFYAAQARITFTGVSVHPGQAYGQMKNALVMAASLVGMLPANESPATSRGDQGYYFPSEIQGKVGSAKVTINIRDFDKTKFEERKEKVREWVASFGQYAQLDMNDQYPNMEDFLSRTPFVAELARSAYKAAGLTPEEVPVRGGTDGAMLAPKGLPCPNLFHGGENGHGPYEYLPILSLEKAEEVVIRLAGLSTTVPVGSI